MEMTCRTCGFFLCLEANLIMTSLERRHEGRYQRRKAVRDARRNERCAEYNNFHNIMCYRSLYRANKKSMRNVSWKASVQRYQMNLLRNMEKTRYSLEHGKDITKGFVEFDIMERGRLRHIRSIHYSERIVQRSTCDNSLVPILRRSLIYDNGACLENKGVDQALDRMTAHLQQFYRANGFSNEGYALVFDFSGFFDNILHSYCFDIYQSAYTNEQILGLLTRFILPFGHPNSVVAYKRVRCENVLDGYTGKSLGLGSQISQITAVAYPSAIDHFIKEWMHVRFYGRYMDDGYMLFKTKSEAKDALRILEKLCSTLSIKLNMRKTQIVKLRNGIRFLKVWLRLTETGKVKHRMTRKSITRQRRKLKKFAAMVAAKEMTVQEAANSYASWKGYAIHRGGYMATKKMDDQFITLFGVKAPECNTKKRRKKSWQRTSQRQMKLQLRPLQLKTV